MIMKPNIRLLVIPIILLSFTLSIRSSSAQNLPHDILETTKRVSISGNGTEADNDSGGSSMTPDGRFVAFGSYASNLVDGDTNGLMDVFVHDRNTGETRRVSVASDGTQGDGWSWHPSISVNGHYVAFQSTSSNLVNWDTNNYCDNDNDQIFDDICADIFVHDLWTGETQRVSIASDGTQGDNYSDSRSRSISEDGCYVVFMSMASNLVDGDTNFYCDTNYDNIFDDNCVDGFIHDRRTGIQNASQLLAMGHRETITPVPLISLRMVVTRL